MRAIDADAFKDYIREACEGLAPLFNDNGKVARLVTENFCKDIDEQPTIHPEIIRCRECKFASGDSRICMKFDHSPIGELDFCSFAERREVTK